MRTDLVEKIPPSDFGKSRDKAAELLGINPHYITVAKQIERDAPELLEKVKRGTLTILQAKKVAALPVALSPGSIAASLLHSRS